MLLPTPKMRCPSSNWSILLSWLNLPLDRSIRVSNPPTRASGGHLPPYRSLKVQKSYQQKSSKNKSDSSLSWWNFTKTVTHISGHRNIMNDCSRCGEHSQQAKTSTWWKWGLRCVPLLLQSLIQLRIMSVGHNGTVTFTTSVFSAQPPAAAIDKSITPSSHHRPFRIVTSTYVSTSRKTFLSLAWVLYS